MFSGIFALPYSSSPEYPVPLSGGLQGWMAKRTAAKLSLKAKPHLSPREAGSLSLLHAVPSLKD